MAEALTSFKFCRRFGFTATPKRMDGTESLMEAFFGPILIDIPYQEGADQGVITPIRYAMPACTKGPMFIEDDMSIGRAFPESFKKTCAYWRNHARNELIAKYAGMAVQAGKQTLIMVETLEHAVFLKELFMQDVPVVHYGRSGENGFDNLAKKILKDRAMQAKVLEYAESKGTTVADKEALYEAARQFLLDKYTLKKKDMLELERQFAAAELPVVIASMVWSEGVNFNKLEVLIRGDGMISEINASQIPGRLSRLCQGKDEGILVDFKDTWTPWALRRADAREKVYRDENNWKKVENIEQVLLEKSKLN